MGNGASKLRMAAASAMRLAYRALMPSPNRAFPSSQIQRGCDGMVGLTRSRAWSTAQDLQQNFSVIGWAIRTHLNFVASFAFQARTKDRDFNRLLEKAMAEEMLKERWDKTRTFSAQNMFRLRAAMKVLYGEGLVVKIDDGTFWLVPHWRIGRGNGAPDNVSPDGLVFDAYGARDGFAICRYDAPPSAYGVAPHGLVHERIIQWTDVIYDGFFQSPDQPRGASPLLPAMAHARDCMDLQEYHLLKTKVAAMFGCVIYRDHSKKGRHDFDYQRPPPAAGQATESADDTDVGPLEYDLRSGLKLELEKDERAEFLESKTPSTETREFLKDLFRQILAALDIPYSAFDSTGANFSGMLADWGRYKLSSLEERGTNQSAYDKAIEHKLRHMIASGRITLPKGWTYEADMEWECIPTGTFILDLSRELDPVLKKIAAGLQSRSDACRELGTGDYYDGIDRLAEEEAYARSRGVTLTLGTPGATTTRDGDGTKSQEDN